jgi:transposase
MKHKPKQAVYLTREQLMMLRSFVRTGKASARELTRARILLLSHDGKTDQSIGDILSIHFTTVRNIRNRFHAYGLEKALHEAPRPGQPKKLTPKQEATVVAIACSSPPDGYGHWTLDLLRDRVESKIKKVHRNVIHRILLTNDLKPWLKKNVVYSNHHR